MVKDVSYVCHVCGGMRCCHGNNVFAVDVIPLLDTKFYLREKLEPSLTLLRVGYVQVWMGVGYAQVWVKW